MKTHDRTARRITEVTLANGTPASRSKRGSVLRRPTWRWCAMALLMGACDPAEPDDDGADDGMESEGDPDEPFPPADEPDDQPNPPDEPANDTADGSGSPSFSRDVAPLLSACSCHVGGAGGLKFGDDPYAALVGMPAFGSGLSYVEPGDVEGSYLLHKIRGTQESVGGSGSSMPPGGALSEEQIATIETWIADGAPE